MLCLTRQVEYALIALAYLAENPTPVASARTIAQARHLSCSLVMKVLKAMHQGGWLSSTRGATGGYRIRIDLETVSLHNLIVVLGLSAKPSASPVGAGHQPVQALQNQLERFLTDVRISDLVIPGRRIDVTLEALHRPRRSSDASFRDLVQAI